MEIVEHNGHAPGWGADGRAHVRSDNKSTNSSSRDSLTFMCAATALAMLLTAVIMLLSSQIAVGFFAAAFSAILGFAVWLLDTADERRHW